MLSAQSREGELLRRAGASYGLRYCDNVTALAKAVRL
jgi:hypothetical protein